MIVEGLATLTVALASMRSYLQKIAGRCQKICNINFIYQISSYVLNSKGRPGLIRPLMRIAPAGNAKKRCFHKEVLPLPAFQIPHIFGIQHQQQTPFPLISCSEQFLNWISKRPSKNILFLQCEQNLKMSPLIGSFNFSNRPQSSFPHFPPALLCCHHCLALSQAYSVATIILHYLKLTLLPSLSCIISASVRFCSPRGSIRPIGGGLIRLPY